MRIKTTLAAVLAATAAAAFADDDEFELVPLTPEDSSWRVSVGVRSAPKLKTKSRVNTAAAVSTAGRVKPASVRGSSAKTGTTTETSVSESTEDGGTTRTGTTKAEAEAASGYTGAARYDFDNGYIDEDVTGPSGKTANWHFDDASAFNGTACSVSGEKSYNTTTKTKTKKKKRKTTKKTETKAADSASRTTLRETLAEDVAVSSSDDSMGLDIQVGRLLYEDESFGVEVNAGYTLYKDVDCFKVGGRVYTGRSTASRGSVETTVTMTTQTETTETTTTTTESGAIATVLQEPELTDLDDIRNPDGSIGGASFDGLPVQPGWTTAFLTVTPDRFSTVDRPNETTASTETTTTEEAPTATTSTSRSPGASVSRTRTIDVQSEGELSLQELRLGVSPYWKAADWLQIRADLGILGIYSEVETRTTIFANGTPYWSSRHENDDWTMQGYAGLSLAVLPADWLEIAAGAEARFPKRRIHFDDGIVSGSTELSAWDAFVSVGVRF